MARISRFPVLTHVQYRVLSEMPAGYFTDRRPTWMVSTLSTLERLGFVEKRCEVGWRRTEKGTSELHRLIGGKD